MEMKKAFFTEKAPRPVGPYSQVVQAGGFLFLAGQIPLTSNGTMTEGDVSVQARQVMENLKAVLEAGGSSLSQVLKTTVFLAEMGDFAAMNEAYGRYFAQEPPARSTVQAAGLPRGVRVEIDVIALA